MVRMSVQSGYNDSKVAEAEMPIDITWLFNDTIPTTHDMRNELSGINSAVSH